MNTCHPAILASTALLFFTNSALSEGPDEVPKSITQTGVTIEYTPSNELSDDIARALNVSPRQTVKLMIRGVVTPKAWDDLSAIHVFINNPEATAKTNPNHPSFSHAIMLSHRDDSRTQTVVLDISPTLQRLRKAGSWKPHESIKITFAISPSSPEAMPPTLKVQFDDVLLSVPPRP